MKFTFKLIAHIIAHKNALCVTDGLVYSSL